MWFDLKAAAAYLPNMSESGLRKVIKRGDIRPFQARKHAPLWFKREWLDEYIEKHRTTAQQEEEQAEQPLAKAPKPAPVANRFGI